MTGLSHECTNAVCSIPCSQVFERVCCFPRIHGGSRVEWVLHPEFRDPQPHLFRLEVSEAAVNDPTAWVSVSTQEKNDVWFLLDPLDRVFGSQQWTHYRIRLRTPKGTYYSDPSPCLGVLDRRQWRLMQAVLRAERKNFIWANGQEGYLLKRKTTGQKCVCLDPLTDEVRNAQCEICQGVGYVTGYYAPVSCVWALLTDAQRHAKLEVNSPRGMGDEIRAQARMLAIPQMYEQDVWVDRSSDFRYFIHTIAAICEIKGVPIVNNVELRQIPFSHPVYKITITGQIPAS